MNNDDNKIGIARFGKFLMTLTVAGIIACSACKFSQSNSSVKLAPAVQQFGTGGSAFEKLLARHLADSGKKNILIETGNNVETIKYYSQVGNYLGLPLVVSSSSSNDFTINTNFTLNTLLQYCGFMDEQGNGLSELNLDVIPSAVLNNPNLLGGVISNSVSVGALSLKQDEILAATYFAPKICDVGPITGSVGAPTTPSQYGWRKVVLLRPRDGSNAKIHQIAGVWILFNYFVSPDAITNAPLVLTNSVNTQVMLSFSTIQQTPSIISNQQPDTDTAYWLDFNATQNGSQLNDALNATFDSGESDLGDKGARNYFVPTACAVCHGDTRSSAALNFLDTDHWYERTRKDAPAGSDFLPIADSPNGVLLDGGKDFSSQSYTNAFQTIQMLNQQINLQNNMSGAQLQSASVEHWLTAHTNNIFPLTLTQRALGVIGNTWTVGDNNLLSYFDRYCYRCHNAIDYNVFSKQDVLDERGSIARKLQLAWVPQNYQNVMPQDRHLDGQVITNFLNLLSQAH